MNRNLYTLAAAHRCSVACLGALLLAGCMKSAPPQFHLDMVSIEEKGITHEQQQTVATVLEAMYGTPDAPAVLPESGLDLVKIERAAGPVWSDEHGNQGGLYRRHCGHCHGTSGDGMGPTAAILDPYPRDYRQGKFKFKSTERAAKPTEADLRRLLAQGVPGTAMPSFLLLPSDEIDALIEYVKYLSMRGQTERALVDAVADLGEGEKLKLEHATLVEEILQPVAEEWSTAKDKIIAPPPKPTMQLAKSIKQGQAIFYGNRANCVKCHGASALGDGQTTDYDDWNKPLADLEKSLAEAKKNRAEAAAAAGDNPKEDQAKAAEDQTKAADRDSKLVAALAAVLPPRTIRPRNLRAGIYRGGGRPLDLYRRFHAGINGVPMPAVGPATPGAQPTLKPEEIWQLVDYVQSLPYESISNPPRNTSVVGSTPR